MNEYWKAVLKRTAWTTLEAFVGAVAGCTAFSEIKWDVVGFAVIVADAICIAKCLKCGVPEVNSAEEITCEQAEKLPDSEYEEQPYNDLYVDDSIDEGKDDEMESED